MTYTPQALVINMQTDLIEASTLLGKLQTLEHFGQIFSEGEQGSIKAMVANIDTKKELLQQVNQQIFHL